MRSGASQHVFRDLASPELGFVEPAAFWMQHFGLRFAAWRARRAWKVGSQGCRASRFRQGIPGMKDPETSSNKGVGIISKFIIVPYSTDHAAERDRWSFHSQRDPVFPRASRTLINSASNFTLNMISGIVINRRVFTAPTPQARSGISDNVLSSRDDDDDGVGHG